VIGISFHIGSGCQNTKAFELAVALARKCFDIAASLGTKMSLLDIGGGFSGDPRIGFAPVGYPSFEQMAEVLQSSFAKCFPKSEFGDLKIIAEPGRYMATAFSTLFTTIVGKRIVPALAEDGSAQHLYYINDGVYGSFNCIMFDHATPLPLSLSSMLIPKDTKETSTATHPLVLGTFFGPTCDSMDVVAKAIPIAELKVGEWLVFEHMGAYTSAAGSTFNGIEPPLKSYVNSVSA